MSVIIRIIFKCCFKKIYISILGQQNIKTRQGNQLRITSRFTQTFYIWKIDDTSLCSQKKGKIKQDFWFLTCIDFQISCCQEKQTIITKIVTQLNLHALKIEHTENNTWIDATVTNS